MSNTDHNRITSLIEQRIREEVQHEGRKAVDAFEAVIKAELAKIGVSTWGTCMHRLVLEVRTQHLDSLVSKRIVELVDKLVQAGQPTAQAEPAAPTFQVGDKVVLNSGGPVMTVTSLVGYDGNLVCEWANGEETDHSCFPPAVLVRAGTVHNPIRP